MRQRIPSPPTGRLREAPDPALCADIAAWFAGQALSLARAADRQTAAAIAQVWATLATRPVPDLVAQAALEEMRAVRALAEKNAEAAARAAEPEYLIWSNQQERWWGPDGRGYTSSVQHAGRYTGAVAARLVDQGNVGDRSGALTPWDGGRWSVANDVAIAVTGLYASGIAPELITDGGTA